MHKTKRGFTIVELLVVLAIIGILATIAIVNYTSSQRRARDTQRQADLEKIAQAVEMYRAENKKYPGGDNTPAITGGMITVGGPLAQALHGYLDNMPCDNYGNSVVTCASGTSTGYAYYRKDATDVGILGTPSGRPYYGLYATLENPPASTASNYIAGTPHGSNVDDFDAQVATKLDVNYVSGIKLP